MPIDGTDVEDEPQDTASATDEQPVLYGSSFVASLLGGKTDAASPLSDRFHSGCVWHVPGERGALAGAHVGHEAIATFLRRALQLTEGSMWLEVENSIDAGDTAVTIFSFNAGRPDGRTLQVSSVLVARKADDLIHEVTLFVWDLTAFENFWS